MCYYCYANTYDHNIFKLIHLSYTCTIKTIPINPHHPKPPSTHQKHPTPSPSKNNHSLIPSYNFHLTRKIHITIYIHIHTRTHSARQRSTLSLSPTSAPIGRPSRAILLDGSPLLDAPAVLWAWSGLATLIDRRRRRRSSRGGGRRRARHYGRLQCAPSEQPMRTASPRASLSLWLFIVV